MALEELVGNKAVSEISGRPFGIDPNIQYNPESSDMKSEFAKRASDLFNLDASSKKLVHNGADLSAIAQITDIATKYMAGDPSENTRILKDPYIALEQANALFKVGYNNIAQFIGNNQRVIVNKIPSKDLMQLALSLPDKDKKYLKISEMIEKEDEKGLREEYAKLFPESKKWQEYLKKQAPHNFVKYYASKYVLRAQNDFVENKLAGNDKEDNPAKLAEYAISTINSYKQDVKQQYLINLAAIYSANLGTKKKSSQYEKFAEAA